MGPYPMVLCLIYYKDRLNTVLNPVFEIGIKPLYWLDKFLILLSLIKINTLLVGIIHVRFCMATLR
jgi:hypothetical protein